MGSKQSLQKLIANYAFGTRSQIVKPASAAEVGTPEKGLQTDSSASEVLALPA